MKRLTRRESDDGKRDEMTRAEGWEEKEKEEEKESTSQRVIWESAWQAKQLIDCSVLAHSIISSSSASSFTSILAPAR
jgi:hypothetical protein